MSYRSCFLPAFAVALLLVACGNSHDGEAVDALAEPDVGFDGASDDVAQGDDELRAIESLATQNAGTTEILGLLNPSPRREVCSNWYENNLCTVDSEALLAEAIEEDTPDVLFLEEVWIQENCGDDQRPGAVNDEPYVCSLGSQPQTERLLPEGYRWGCAAGYPDNCIGFKSDVFHPDDEAACDGRNCSAAVVSMAAPDSRDGRIAYLTGTSAAGPTILVVVHTNAGIEASDTARRASQLGALKDVLLAAGEETTLFIAGDFNLDPTEGLGQDANALRDMADELGLVRVPDDGYTHRMINGDLDVVLARGWTPADNATCHVRFLDEGAETPMFDHAFLLCH